MKQIRYRAVAAVIAAITLCASSTQVKPVYASDEGSVVKVTVKKELAFHADTETVSDKDKKFRTAITFESYDDADTGFNDRTESIMIGDTKFVLNSIENLKMTDAYTPERRTMETMTDTFIKGEEDGFLPDTTVTKDGVTWTLTEKTLVDSEIGDRTKEAVATKRYVGVEKGVPVPDSIEYTCEDESTGLTVNTMLPLTDQSETTWRWEPFEFPISISGYGADVLDLNGTEVPSGAPLIDYADEFLNLLGLSKDYYRIDAIEWDGEPYEQNGEIYRDAVGTGEKYVTDIEAVYSATIDLPHLDGAAWKCLYTEELDPSSSTVYTYTADAVYISTAEQTPFERILGVISAFYHRIIEAIQDHPVLAALQIVVIAALIVFLVSRRKKKCLYDDSRKCIYGRDCANCPYYTTLSKETASK